MINKREYLYFNDIIEGKRFEKDAEWDLGLKKDIILNAFFFRITNIGVKNGVKPEYHQTMSASRQFWFLFYVIRELEVLTG